MNYKEIVKTHGPAIRQDAERMVRIIRDEYHDRIEACLMIFGLEFNWQHSPEPFEDFVAREIAPVDDLGKRAAPIVLEWWKKIKEADEYESKVYNAIREASNE